MHVGMVLLLANLTVSLFCLSVPPDLTTFIVNPSSHLAFPRPGASTHRVLQPYDEAFNPGCLQRTFQELQFLHTDIRQALRALNSTMGVTSDIIQEIIRDCTDCTVCKCQFSHDSFNHHIRGGFCWNHPEPTAGTLLLGSFSIMLILSTL
jgi:hypothetical protein